MGTDQKEAPVIAVHGSEALCFIRRQRGAPTPSSGNHSSPNTLDQGGVSDKSPERELGVEVDDRDAAHASSHSASADCCKQKS